MSKSSNKNEIHIGVLGAMPEEIGISLNDLNEVEIIDQIEDIDHNDLPDLN